MNLALPPLVIFALALPGILFRSAYRKGLETTPLSIRSAPEEIALAVLAAIGLHFLGVQAIRLLSCGGVQLSEVFETLFRLMTSALGRDAKEEEHIYRMMQAQMPWAGLYFTLVSTAGAFLGNRLQILVRHCFWDVRVPWLFRFPGPWQYLFSGRAYLTQYVRDHVTGRKATRKDYQEALDLVSLVYVYGVLDQASKSWVYGGLLEDHVLNLEGNLDRLILCNAFRFPLPEKNDPAESMLRNPFANPAVFEKMGYYRILADRLVIQYEDMRTLSVQYTSMEEVKNGTASFAVNEAASSAESHPVGN